MNLAKVFSAEGAISTFGVLSTLLVVNLLGFEARGVMFELQNFAGLFAAIAFLGLNVSLPKTPELASASLFCCVAVLCLVTSLAIYFSNSFSPDNANLFLTFSLCHSIVMLSSIVLLARADLFRYAILNSLINLSLIVYCVFVGINFLIPAMSTFKVLIYFSSCVAGIVAAVFYFQLVNDLSVNFGAAVSTIMASTKFAPYTLFSGAPLYYVGVSGSLTEYYLGLIAVLLSFSNLVLKFCRHVLISRLSKLYDHISVSFLLDFWIFTAVVLGTYISLFIFFPIPPNDYIFEIILIGMSAALLPRIASHEGEALAAENLISTTLVRFLSLLAFVALLEGGLSFGIVSPVGCFALALLGARLFIYVFSRILDHQREICH